MIAKPIECVTQAQRAASSTPVAVSAIAASGATTAVTEGCGQLGRQGSNLQLRRPREKSVTAKTQSTRNGNGTYASSGPAYDGKTPGPTRNEAAISGAASNPRGICGCGCGRATTLFRKSNANRGQVRGEFARYVHGHQPHLQLEQHPFWKGDAARTEAKRGRIQRRLALGQCEGCAAKATDRHHKDGNTGNNDPSNIARLCRRCHMRADGRLARLAAMRMPKQPPKPCVNCHQLAKPLRRGRCGTCDKYLSRTGVERPAVQRATDAAMESCWATLCERCDVELHLPGDRFCAACRADVDQEFAGVPT